MLYVILLALTAVAALLAIYMAYKRKRLKNEIEQVTTCGYVAPTPGPAATARLLKVARCLTNIQVGAIKFVDRENLDNLIGPRIISANHPHWADAVIMPQLIRGPARYMATDRVMTAAGGLLGVFLSKGGIFTATDKIRDGGERTRAAAIQMVVNKETLVVLPEGLTNFSPTMGPFKNGVAIIARTAAERLGEEVYVVPNYIRYGRYPGPWLSKFDRPVQFFLVLLGFPLFRRKAVVVTGKPIGTTELFTKPDGTKRSDDEASAFLRERIAALDPGKVD
jgi:1-acyl-sn-glycerol-3-phosphate acyltransferase